MKVLIVSELNPGSFPKVLKLSQKQTFDLIFALTCDGTSSIDHCCLSLNASPNCTSLGSHGIYRSGPLSFAFISKNSDNIPTSIQPVDVLLSFEWPTDILKNSHLVKDGMQETGASALVRDACLALRPRYILSCSTGFYFEREPFRDPEDHNRITRFIGLAPFGGKEKVRLVVDLRYPWMAL
jgi:hypothetical protein